MSNFYSHSGWLAPKFLVIGLASCTLGGGLPSGTTQALIAQEPAPTTEVRSDQDRPAIPQILDEPRFVDPTDFLPTKLTKRVTVDMRSASLAELAEWLQTEVELTVLAQLAELEAEGISPSDPVSDWLENEPLYLLLDRLRLIDVGWYYEGDILYLTSQTVIENERQAKVPYLLGELLDKGYTGDQIVNLIESMVEPDSWEPNGGNGRINLIGDVIFVRSTDAVQRKVQGFLNGIERHGRQTMIDVSASDLLLQDKLMVMVSVDYHDIPLEDAIRDLATQTGADLRLDRAALRDMRIRERQPVTLQVRQQPMQTILNYLLPQLGLVWRIRDGVLWVTSREEDEEQLTGFYDVRDLCRDKKESAALSEAVQSQIPNVFEAEGGNDVIDFGKPGTLIVLAPRSVHAVVLDLLEKYRFALRQSKLRKPSEAADEVKTLYYRIHANVARTLHTELPKLVAPESWRSTERPDAIGTIMLLESPPEVTPNEGSAPIISERMVLVIQQRQSIHGEIAKTLQKIEKGDEETRAIDSNKTSSPSAMGGGFGGGMFSVPTNRPK